MTQSSVLGRYASKPDLSIDLQGRYNNRPLFIDEIERSAIPKQWRDSLTNRSSARVSAGVRKRLKDEDHLSPYLFWQQNFQASRDFALVGAGLGYMDQRFFDTAWALDLNFEYGGISRQQINIDIAVTRGFHEDALLFECGLSNLWTMADMTRASDLLHVAHLMMSGNIVDNLSLFGLVELAYEHTLAGALYYPGMWTIGRLGASWTF